MYGGMPPYMQFLMHVQGPDASHMIPYAGPGSQSFTHKCLQPTLHTQFLKLGQVPDASNAILRLVQVPDASHTIPYSGTGSLRFTGQSLYPMLNRPILELKLHRPILTPKSFT
ncbi:hypothetical protein O181_059807 [Austropuccinia psidii MF-1]|uniref:Uncharacterized protein n=1 Tax=Austropuccinia psidii MF-1 TaxID=1389203 RepID=A0A9Q3HXS3_9BASI|nr:hypothetical protein [Austropuccinia psidii MF-1]